MLKLVAHNNWMCVKESQKSENTPVSTKAQQEILTNWPESYSIGHELNHISAELNHIRSLVNWMSTSGICLYQLCIWHFAHFSWQNYRFDSSWNMCNYIEVMWHFNCAYIDFIQIIRWCHYSGWYFGLKPLWILYSLFEHNGFSNIKVLDLIELTTDVFFPCKTLCFKIISAATINIRWSFHQREKLIHICLHM